MYGVLLRMGAYEVLRKNGGIESFPTGGIASLHVPRYPVSTIDNADCRGHQDCNMQQGGPLLLTKPPATHLDLRPVAARFDQATMLLHKVV